MFAVIRTGGKQYRVRENSCIEVERLAGSPGDTLTFDDVLMVGGAGSEAPMIGKAAQDTAAVFAKLVAQTRGDKVLVFKKKRRKNYRRMRGHRQDLTVVRITAISPSGERPAASETSPAAGEPAETTVPREDAAGAPASSEGEGKE